MKIGEYYLKPFTYKLLIITLLLFVSFQLLAKTEKVKLGKLGKVYIETSFSEFSLFNIKKFKESHLGVGFSYYDDKTPMLGLKYYIYPLYKDLSIENIMSFEYKNLLQSNKVIAKSDLAVLTVKNSNNVVIKGNKYIHVVFHLERDGTTLVSEYYLSSQNGHFLKIHASYPLIYEDKLDIGHRVSYFVKEVFDKTKFKLKYSFSKNINVTNQNSIPMGHSKKAIAYSNAVINSLDESLIDSFQDFLNIYKAYINKLKEEASSFEIGNKDSVLLEIYETGFLKEYIWDSYARPYWSKPNDLNQKKYIEWLNQLKIKDTSFRPHGVKININKIKI